MAMIGVIMVLVAHGHYTIDILIAYYITTRLFWTYHTLVNNSFLIKVKCLLGIFVRGAEHISKILVSFPEKIVHYDLNKIAR